MAIDFGKISSGNTSNTAIHPREIFIALPGKKEGKYEYPRAKYRTKTEWLAIAAVWQY